jgi:hypothetical protein
MTVNWTPEPARVEQPPHPHNALAWALWIASAAVIISWGVCMALGVWMGGRVHLLLALFAVLMIIHIILGFKNVEYFVPLRLTGRWFRGWGGRRDVRVNAYGTLQDDPAASVPRKGDIIPGNDPVSGPGQRKPHETL